MVPAAKPALCPSFRHDDGVEGFRLDPDPIRSEDLFEPFTESCRRTANLKARIRDLVRVAYHPD
jgi:hypothetical protein